MVGGWGRIFSIALGVWLFLSTWMWQHTPQQYNNTWISGSVVVIFALLSLAWPAIRQANVVVAVWLVISAFTLPTTGPTVWNNVIVGVLLFAASLLRERGTHRGPYSHRRVTV